MANSIGGSAGLQEHSRRREHKRGLQDMATIFTEDGETRNKQYPVHWPRERGLRDAIRREMALLGGEFVQEGES